MQRSASLAVSTGGGTFRGSRLNQRSGILGGGSADPLAITTLAGETQPHGGDDVLPTRIAIMAPIEWTHLGRRARILSRKRLGPAVPCCWAMLFQRRGQAMAMASFPGLTDGSQGGGIQIHKVARWHLMSNHACLSAVVQHYIRFFLASGAVVILSHSFPTFVLVIPCCLPASAQATIAPEP